MKRFGKLKKTIAVFTAAAMILSVINISPASASVTGSQTPAEVYYGALEWEHSFGSGWSSSPMPPVIDGDYLYTAAGSTLYKLNKDSGEVISHMTLDGSTGFSTIAPVIGYRGESEKLIFVPISGGKLEAVSLSDMEKAWTTTPVTGDTGQTISPVTYNDGRAYYATWNGKGKTGYYYCVNTEDGTRENLPRENPEGYYWAGAYATDSYVIFGSQADSSGSAAVYSMKPDFSSLIDSVTVEGNVCSDVLYYDGYAFVLTDKALLYKIPVENDGTLGTPSSLDLDGTSAGGATLYEGKIYAGVCDSSSQFGSSGQYIRVIDCGSMRIDTSAPVPGFAKAEKLISTQNEADGKLYLYTTYNRYPGGIYMIEVDDNSGIKTINTGNSGTLFTPLRQQYCISPVIADDAGTLYYKNDSGYMMAVKAGYALSSSATTGGSITPYSSVTAGGSKTFYMSPYPGYRIADVRADGTSVGSQNSYTFSDVQAPHSISAVFIPSAAPALTISNSSYKSLKLKWGSMANVSGYKIYRATSKSGSYSLIKTLSSGSTSYTDTGLKTGKTYYYKISGFYGSTYTGTAAGSAKVRPAAPSAGTYAGKRSIKVKWKHVSGAGGYKIYRATKKSGKYKEVKTISKGSAESWTNRKLKKGKRYYYKVRAYRKAGGKKVFSGYSNISYKKAK